MSLSVAAAVVVLLAAGCYGLNRSKRADRMAPGRAIGIFLVLIVLAGCAVAVTVWSGSMG